MKCDGSVAGVTDAMAWARSWPSVRSREGWQNEGDRLGTLTLQREMTPGGQYSGCPGSRSRTIMLDHGLFLEPARSVIRRFATSLPNVDFPDDFGPQIKTTGVIFRPAAASAESFLFHSAGEASSCRMVLLGASSEVYI